MLSNRHADAFTETHPWAARNEIWQSFSGTLVQPRRLRQRNPTPLILCGHGVSLRVEGGALAVRDGFTHYPQEQGIRHLFPGDLALPPRIILLDGSGTLSFDVLSWLAEQGIPLIRIKWNGEIATAVGDAYFDRKKVDWQRATRADELKRVAFAADLIQQKLRASIPTLQRCFEPSSALDVALASAASGIERLSQATIGSIRDVFGIEGECASTYFRALTGMPIRWTGTGRKLIPDNWRSYSGRTSLATGVSPENRNASHPVNAMLNYGYTVMLARVQVDAIAKGYDPMLGIMHDSRKNGQGWVLDMLEPFRPIVDALVLNLLREHPLAAADFTIRRDGVCRLSPQLARVVATLVSAAGAEMSKDNLPGRRPARRKQSVTA